MYLKNGSLKFEVHPHQFNLTLHHRSQFVFKVTKKSSKVCDWLVKWLIDVNGFKVAEGFSTFQRRSCLYCYLIQKYPVSNEDGKFYWRSNTMQICPLFELVCLSGKQYNWKYFVDISSSQFHKKKDTAIFDVSNGCPVYCVPGISDSTAISGSAIDHQVILNLFCGV